jgi:ABC-type glutathione transport system ATPase component
MLGATDGTRTPQRGELVVGMDDTHIINVEELRRRYGAAGRGGFDAVQGVSFTVRGGELFALLGTNGAGKTSTLAAGISARVIGDGAHLTRTTQAALGWVVREATTNIIRHSDPTTVRIELDVVHAAGAGPAAVLRIENDGVR